MRKRERKSKKLMISFFESLISFLPRNIDKTRSEARKFLRVEKVYDAFPEPEISIDWSFMEVVKIPEFFRKNRFGKLIGF